jgi:hypothetical protein
MQNEFFSPGPILRQMLLVVAWGLVVKARVSPSRKALDALLFTTAGCNIVLLFVIQKHRLRALHPLLLLDE